MLVRRTGRAFTKRRHVQFNDISGGNGITSSVAARSIICPYQLDSNSQSTSLTSSERCFSSTPSRPKGSKQQKRERQLAKTPLPIFKKTGNAELDALLQKLHREQFSIDHLPDHYHRLVTKTKKHHILAEQAAEQAFARGTNPANAVLTVTIDDQPIVLKPVNKHVKYGSKTLTEALNLIKTPAELDNLPGLVQAMAYSGIEISKGQWQKLIRVCGAFGRPGIAVQIARDGLLDRKNKFVYTMSSYRDMVRTPLVRFMLPEKKHATEAIQRAKSAVSTAKAMKEWFEERSARMRLDLKPPEWIDADPVVKGTILFLKAGKAVRWNNGIDVKEDVVSAVKDLMKSWDIAADEVEKVTKQTAIAHAEGMGIFNLDEERSRPWMVARRALRDWEPVLQGLKWTQQVMNKSSVKDSEINSWLVPTITSLSKAIEELKGLAVTGGHSEALGLQIFEQAYEKQGNWFITDVNQKPANAVNDKIIQD